MALIGRLREQNILAGVMESDDSSFVAVYGRRRVGKTYLIKEFFRNRFTFYVTGIVGSPHTDMRTQINNFATALREYGGENAVPEKANWMDSFAALRRLIEATPGGEKKVIFLDEMPSLDTPRSGFLDALDLFWNSFASSRHDVVLIACGSASSWMISNVINNTGGLYRRVTTRLAIEPFTLHECEQYLNSRHIIMNRPQILECYMILGGVPFYLSLLNPELGLAENIDNLFFANNPLLDKEFDILYTSLFRTQGAHKQVVEALSSKSIGLTRQEIADRLKMSEGGRLSQVLRELEESAFLRSYRCFPNVERNTIWQLIDPFTLFHLYNVKKNNNDPHYWQKFMASPGHSSWSGHAFEMVCLLHAEQLKAALGADRVVANTFSWQGSYDGSKAQIDLVVDRMDRIIDLCECKYRDREFPITDALAASLRRKASIFQEVTKTKKTVRSILVTTWGILPGKHAKSVQQVVTMDKLFEEIR